MDKVIAKWVKQFETEKAFLECARDIAHVQYLDAVGELKYKLLCSKKNNRKRKLLLIKVNLLEKHVTFIEDLIVKCDELLRNLKS